MKRKPIVAVIGRPNVGKSTFVNRIVGSRKSIVDDTPGVTRDRIYFDGEWQGKEFTIIDTGGIVPYDDDEIMVNILAQAEVAMEEADEIIFIVDGKSGEHPVDRDIANILRQSKTPVHLAVNKIDSPANIDMLNDFYALSLGDPIGISSLHGSGGVGDLLDVVTKDFERSDGEKGEETIRIAIVGKPNAGKSSIVNALLNENRVIVSEVSGTTRDSIDSKIKFEGREFVLVDTAGIRKKARVEWGVEKFAVDRAIRAIRDADVAVLVVDATEGLTDQDKKISQIVTENGKAMVLAINKWDIVENKDTHSLHQFEKNIEKEAPFLNYVPKIFISATTKQRLTSIYKEALNVYEQSLKKVSTNLLNKIISEATSMNPPTSHKGKRLNILYTTQFRSAPPSFMMFVNNPDLMKDSYKRYLEKRIREAYGFFGSPIRIVVKEKAKKNR